MHSDISQKSINLIQLLKKTMRKHKENEELNMKTKLVVLSINYKNDPHPRSLPRNFTPNLSIQDMISERPPNTSSRNHLKNNLTCKSK